MQVETLLRNFEQLIQVESFAPQLVEDRFTIAATDYAQLVVLPSLIIKIRKAAPKLKVVIRDFDETHLSELMAEGRIDLTITFSGGISDNYPTLTLFKDHHVCVASENSLLTDHTLSAEDISTIPQIIATPVGPNFVGSVSSSINKADLAKNAVITVPCFSFVPLYLESDDAIAFLPSRAAQDDQLIQLELDDAPIDFEIIATWHPRSNNDPLHQWIIQLLQHQYHPNG